MSQPLLGKIVGLELQVEEMREERDALAKDAQRYRWLRDQCQSSGSLTIAKTGGWDLEPWSGDDPDAAIDAAIAKEKLA